MSLPVFLLQSLRAQEQAPNSNRNVSKSHQNEDETYSGTSGGS